MTDTAKAQRVKKKAVKAAPKSASKSTRESVKSALKPTKTTKTSVKAALKRNSKAAPISEKQTRIEILQHISDKLELTRVSVESVFDELANLVSAHLGKRGSGEFMIPKLGIKIRRVRRKPTKKRVMVSPLTGTEVTIAAKPARDDVKISAMKALKERVLA